MIFDIALIQIFALPIPYLTKLRTNLWVNAIGGFDIWQLFIYPKGKEKPDKPTIPLFLELGANVEITNDPQKALTGLVLKALVFFVIYLQIKALTSSDYDKVMLKGRSEKAKVQ